MTKSKVRRTLTQLNVNKDMSIKLIIYGNFIQFLGIFKKKRLKKVEKG